MHDFADFNLNPEIQQTRFVCLEHVLKDTWGPPAHAPAILGPGNPRKSAKPFAWIFRGFCPGFSNGRPERKAQNPPKIHREFAVDFRFVPAYN